jgi:hypothetical protein
MNGSQQLGVGHAQLTIGNNRHSPHSFPWLQTSEQPRSNERTPKKEPDGMKPGKENCRAVVL